jgi:hypothetical protein
MHTIPGTVRHDEMTISLLVGRWTPGVSFLLFDEFDALYPPSKTLSTAIPYFARDIQ